MSDQHFGDWLRQHLLRREWNLSDFARRAGLDPSLVSRWARNERVPSPESCDRIADALALPVDVVLTAAGHRPHVEATPVDDPAELLCGLIRRIDLTKHDRFESLLATLQVWHESDRKSRS